VLMIIVVMLVIVAVATLVMTFVAYPHRGHDVPRAPWLGEAMTRAVESLPIVDNTEGVPTGPRVVEVGRGPAGAGRGTVGTGEAGRPKGSARAS